MIQPISERLDRSSATMPEGAVVGYARALLVDAGCTGATPTISVWTAPQGEGTPVMWGGDGQLSWAYFGAQHPRTRSREALSLPWLRRLLQSTTLARDLSGVFALIVVDKQTHQILVVGDRLGVQGVHYGFDSLGRWRASTHLMWLLLASGHDGSVHEDGFLSHMAFGYGVDPSRDVYMGIRTLSPSGYASFQRDRVTRGTYWDAPEPAASVSLDDVAELVDALRVGITTTSGGLEPFVGLTAGKDSLCLAAVMPEARPIRAGTLGATGCADHEQAVSVASRLGWTHVAEGVCDSSEFWHWADHVAFQSAGLATASYADMAAFVAKRVPTGSAFVMGEGGECVRDFFRADERRSVVDRLVGDYMTPVAYLQATLGATGRSQLVEYPHRLIASLRATLDTRDDAHFVSNFYRFQRMAGNFSLRNAVLGTIRPKVSPFLDSRFIDATYGVSLAEHVASAMHRRIIVLANGALLPYFDSPVQSRITTQQWPVRLPALAGEFESRMRQLGVFADDVLDPVGMHDLSVAMRRQPDRAGYHLFRLYSFVAARALLRVDAATRLRAIQRECQLTTATINSRTAAAESHPTNATVRQIV
jgi:hypothetical protein